MCSGDRGGMNLVKIVAWVRGVGQGYALTPAGQAAVSDPSALAHLGGPADSPALPVAAPAADPDGSASARPE